MTIDYILNRIFGEDMKWHCKDVNSKAMAEFNVACPFGSPFSEPIIDVKEVIVKTKWLTGTHKTYEGQEEIKVVCLINSDDEEDIDKGMTVKEVIERLKEFDSQLDLCSMDKNYKDGWVCAFINVFDGTDNDECEKYNIPKDYKGTITNFLT